MEKVILVLTNIPNLKKANKIAYTLIEKKLAACVNIIPCIQSIYKWKKSITNTTETLLIIKSTEICYSELEVTINRMHSYKIPEIISIPIERGLSTYLNWIITETKK